MTHTFKINRQGLRIFKPNMEARKRLIASNKKFNKDTKKWQKERLKLSQERSLQREQAQREAQDLEAIRANVGNTDSVVSDADHDAHTTNSECISTHHAWGKYSIESLVRLYVSAMALGKPNMALTDPRQPQSTCSCHHKRTKTVTLYMLCGNPQLNWNLNMNYLNWLI